MFTLKSLDCLRRENPTETHNDYMSALRSAHLGMDFGDTQEVIIDNTTGQIVFRWEQ